MLAASIGTKSLGQRVAVEHGTVAIAIGATGNMASLVVAHEGRPSRPSITASSSTTSSAPIPAERATQVAEASACPS